MMSSLGSDKARGPREKAIPAATHTSQQQKQIQVSGHEKWNNLIEHFSEKWDTSVCTQRWRKTKAKGASLSGEDFSLASRY